MKKLFIKIFIMFILMVTVIWIITLIPLPEESYDLAIIDKHRILANTKGPKMVLAGGSNLAFGIDSADIKNELHIPVVNMGVHAGFGLGRILDDISPFLNSGDILLIVPEYEYFTNAWNGSETAYELIFDAKQYRLLLSFYYGLPSNIQTYFSTKNQGIKQKPKELLKNPQAYSRDGFNEYGDYIKHLKNENSPISSTIDIGILNRTYLKHFLQFVNYFSKRGITVLLSYPSFEEKSFRNIAIIIQTLDTAFRTEENLSVISTPESFCFPTNYFFDAVYHLNKEGRAVRTRQLIQDLQASGIFNIQ